MAKIARPPTPEEAATLRRHDARALAREVRADVRTVKLAQAGGPVSRFGLYALLAGARALETAPADATPSAPGRAA